MTRLTEVEDEREETGAEEEGEEHGNQSVSVLEKTRGKCSLIALPKLNTNEDGNHETKSNKQANDLGVVPGVLSTTPLKSQEKTDDTGNEDCGTSEIESENTSEEGFVLGFVGVAVDVNEKEDDDHGQATDRQVDVEAPSPGSVFGEDSSEKGTCDGSNSPHTTNETECERTLLKGHCESQYMAGGVSGAKFDILIRERMTMEPEKRPAVPIYMIA